MGFDLASYRTRLADLAGQGVFLGTSSWKYPGWGGLIYEEQRYLTRGKFSEAKFERECLEEYGRTFRTVCVDAGYYKFPSKDYLTGLCGQVPPGFQFGFKVTDEITVKRFPGLARFGARAGKGNVNFLNAELFRSAFLGSCEGHREKVGPLIFEFSTFHKGDFEHGRDFMTALDRFLGELPRGWRYGVELRNKKWLVAEYFAMLRSHGVAHVFNSWTGMPGVLEQLALTGSDTADFMVARLLLKPGRKYADAVEAFSPYNVIQEANPEVREGLLQMIKRLMRQRVGFFYVNNRLEGCAPMTIAETLNAMGALPPAEE